MEAERQGAMPPAVKKAILINERSERDEGKLPAIFQRFTGLSRQREGTGSDRNRTTFLMGGTREGLELLLKIS
jgi:hypothetical protein